MKNKYIQIIFDCKECGEALTIENSGTLMSSKSICLGCGEQYLISLTINQPTDAKATYRNERWLKGEYEKNMRSMASIAEECAVSPMTIFKWLVTHGIETRPTGRRKK